MNIYGTVPAIAPRAAPMDFTTSQPLPPEATRSANTTVGTTTVQRAFVGFPTLQAAIVTKLDIGAAKPIGVNFTGSSMIHFDTPSGIIETVPGFAPAFQATVNFGADWLSFDPDNGHARIDLRGIAEDSEGYGLDFRYTGVIALNEDVMKIFDQQPDMKTVPFGYATGHHTFRTANPRLKDLESQTYVSNGRIAVMESGLVVETRQCLVVVAQVMDWLSTVFD